MSQRFQRCCSLISTLSMNLEHTYEVLVHCRRATLAGTDDKHAGGEPSRYAHKLRAVDSRALVCATIVATLSGNTPGVRFSAVRCAVNAYRLRKKSLLRRVPSPVPSGGCDGAQHDAQWAVARTQQPHTTHKRGAGRKRRAVVACSSCPCYRHPASSFEVQVRLSTHQSTGSVIDKAFCGAKSLNHLAL